MASTLGGALEEHLGSYSDIGLKTILIGLGIFLIAIALLPVNRWVKYVGRNYNGRTDTNQKEYTLKYVCLHCQHLAYTSEYEE